MLVDTAVRGSVCTLFQSASTPKLQAALPAICWSRSLWIPLGRCSADHDSGRGIEHRKFYPKDASFQRLQSLRLT
jgi:hypothetical protein